MKYLLGMVVVLVLQAPVQADDWPQWRGPHRDGLSQEKALLQSWPKEGPKLVWSISNAGRGYSTPSVVGDRFYLLGNEGLEKEFVAAFAVSDGKQVWSTTIGKVGNPNQKPNYPATRSTPTLDGKWLYALGSDGDLVCLDTASGKVKWKKNVRADFHGKPGEWAYSESPLIFGDLLICSPGGEEATLLALKKETGDVAWKCAVPGGDTAAYASAIYVEAAGRKQCVQTLQKGLVGVDITTGEFLWRWGKLVSKYNATIPTPLASGDMVYAAAAGTGGGVVKLIKKDKGVEPEQIYFESKLPTAIGGVVKVGKYLYGTTAQALLCVEFATGNVKWEERAIGAASLCFADNRLYLHGENGDVALVEPSANGYLERGRFTPSGQAERKDPSEKSWAYPVVANGVLYIRDHQKVWAYQLRNPK
jgi:outer membrane protein assembly factor BamB